ncbi:MAG: radical SAM protein [Gemmatimonadales bacterium]|nr:radical SAM protein [Gemmatimonadales bacterium]
MRVGKTSQLSLPVEPGPGKARELTVLDQRQRGTRFLSLGVRSVLNSPASTGMGFWSINPYVGCEFGCTYCYARDTHRYATERAEGRTGERAEAGGEMPPWLAFEKRILIKTDIAERLARTLDPSKLGDDSLVIGTATDPYQPAERRYRLTRSILEVLGRFRGLRIGIISKSPLVTRDIDLLLALGARHEVTVNVSLSTLDSRIARRLELRSPVPSARIRALSRLSAAGVYAGLLVAPIVPGVTDDRQGLSRLMAAAKAAGARYVIGSALRLGPAARHRFLPHLAREFPDLAERYRQHYGDREGVSRDYQAALTRRLERLQREHGFPLEEERRRRTQLEGRRASGARPPEQPALL